MDNKKKDINFKQAFKQLEKIVNDLESNEIDLEGSLEIFKQGMHLYNICSEKLDNAEIEFKKLIKDSDGNFHLDVIE